MRQKIGERHMRWISKNEIDNIQEWAATETTFELKQKYLKKKKKNKESYWDKHFQQNEIMEYDFENIPQMKRLLENNLTDPCYDDLINVLCVATFKAKKRSENIENNEINQTDIEDDFVIPDFVYKF